MKTIYLVTSGEYSDYRVCGVFDSKELAEKFMSSFNPIYDEQMIEEFTLNPYKNELSDGYKAYFLRMNKQGECTEIQIKDSSYGMEGKSIDLGFDINNNMYISIFAKDEKHAIKIANEKRAQLIANNTWGR